MQTSAFSIFSRDGLAKGFVAFGSLLALAPLVGGIQAFLRGRLQVGWGIAGMICGTLAATVGFLCMLLPVQLGFIIALVVGGFVTAGLGVLNFTWGRARQPGMASASAPLHQVSHGPLARLSWRRFSSLTTLSF